MARILVGIANHGTKNLAYLDAVLAAYRAMTHDVDVVVFSDTAKDLGPGGEVRVGAPTADPRSLPFAPRPLFAERAADYDLFVYSEDDTLIEQRHLDAFLEVSAILPHGAIPGFMRYEVDDAGAPSYCSVHSAYHWDPESIRTHGGLVFAAFTNPHSACYVLTRDQLAHVVRSGGFLVEPHAGPRRDMLEAAASDPYTRCGLERLICVSRIDDFLLHHLPNVYLGRFGVDRQAFTAQCEAIERLAASGARAGRLIDGVPRLDSDRWHKPYFPHLDPVVLDEVGTGARSVLSVGCGSGDLEGALVGRGVRVVAVPVDDVVGAAAAARGVQTLPADLDAALEQVAGEQFDAAVLADVVAYVEDPPALLRRLRAVLAPGARVIVTAPNFRHHRLRHRLGRGPDLREDVGFAQRGLHLTVPRTLRAWLRQAGLDVERERFASEGRADQVRRLTRGRADAWLGMTCVTTAHLSLSRHDDETRRSHPTPRVRAGRGWGRQVQPEGRDN